MPPVLEGDDRVGAETEVLVDRGQQLVVAVVIVWRIRVDDVENLRRETLDSGDRVRRERSDRDAELFREPLDRQAVLPRLIDRDRARRAARDRFEREDAAARKEIEKSRAFDRRPDDVEERLPRALRSRTDFAARDRNAAPAQRAGRDPQCAQRRPTKN